MMPKESMTSAAELGLAPAKTIDELTRETVVDNLFSVRLLILLREGNALLSADVHFSN